jgi:uncharacterized protein (DUF427 family)
MAAEPLEDQAVGPSRGGDAVRTEPWPRRVRGVLHHEVVVDTTEAVLQFEEHHLAVWYFPEQAIRLDLLEPSTKRTECPVKGTASYWHLRVGDDLVKNAVWSYQDPIPGREDLAGLYAFYWDKLDAWFEEDDEVFVHPRDPYHRVDVLNSSRTVRVELDGVVLAESSRPRLLFETSLPMRSYLPRADVHVELLEPSATTSQCPYKGVASYWSARIGDRLVPDIAWTYRFPIPECPKVEGLIAFYDEHVDTYLDGILVPRPETPWST